jgi:hypothetical protein
MNIKNKKFVHISAILLLLNCLYMIFMPFACADVTILDFNESKVIVINSSQVSGDLINFPVGINITNDDFIGAIRSDAYDVAFFNDTGRQLHHEIVSFDSINGSLKAWVNVTELSSSNDTFIKIRYGNEGMISSCENVIGTWSYYGVNLSADWNTTEYNNLVNDSVGGFIKAVHNLSIFGYGDSIMNGEYLEILVEEDHFTRRLESDHQVNYTGRNMDGGGMTTFFGLGNYSKYIYGNNTCTVLEQFGINDVSSGRYIDSVTPARNKLLLYNMSVENNTDHIPMIPTLSHPTLSNRPGAWQNESIIAMEASFIYYGVRFIPLYDCLDSTPYNGRLDNYFNGGCYHPDELHINKSGHERMSDFIYFFLSGQDYSETYYYSNDTIVIYANYNQTIHVEMCDDWSYDDVIVYCKTNDTFVNHSNAHGYNTDRITFSVLNNSVYVVKDMSDYTLSISYDYCPQMESEGLVSTSYTIIALLGVFLLCTVAVAIVFSFSGFGGNRNSGGL